MFGDQFKFDQNLSQLVLCLDNIIKSIYFKYFQICSDLFCLALFSSTTVASDKKILDGG